MTDTSHEHDDAADGVASTPTSEPEATAVETAPEPVGVPAEPIEKAPTAQKGIAGFFSRIFSSN